MNLRIVRHAESTANSEERWQGRADFPLSRAGVWQVEHLRARLEREDYTPTRIYSSPLSPGARDRPDRGVRLGLSGRVLGRPRGERRWSVHRADPC